MGPASRSGASKWNAVFWIAGVAILQTTVLCRSPAGWKRPDLLLIVALSIAFVADHGHALACAFAAGLTADCLSCGPPGMHAAVNLVAVWSILQSRNVLFSRRSWMQALIAFVVNMVVSVVHIGVLFATCGRPALAASFRQAVGASISAALLVPLLVQVMGGAREEIRPFRHIRFKQGGG